MQAVLTSSTTTLAGAWGIGDVVAIIYKWQPIHNTTETYRTKMNGEQQGQQQDLNLLHTRRQHLEGEKATVAVGSPR